MILDYFRRLTFQSFLHSFYAEFSGQGWSLLSSAPHYMNVAFPDFCIQYFIASFSKKDQVIVTGRIPFLEVSYWSLTLYDTNGLPLYNWTDKDFIGEQYSLSLYNGSPTRLPDYYTLIIRFYRNSDYIHSNMFTWLPRLHCNGLELEPVPIRKRNHDSLSMTVKLYQLLTKRRFSSIQKPRFFLPPSKNLNSLFPNPDAMYLVAFPSKTNVIKIKGKLPKNIGINFSRRFLSFMAGDLATTATDDSISNGQLSENYLLFVAFEKKEAKKYGFDPEDPHHHLILWKKGNQNPLLIYREVRLDQKGLFRFQKETNGKDWEEVRKAMGIYYPMVMVLDE